jgi:hypothetical protein
MYLSYSLEVDEAMSATLTTSETMGALATVHRRFRGAVLREPIPFKPQFLRKGNITIPTVRGVNFADFLMLLARVDNVDELEEELEVYREQHATGPIGFKQNFGRESNSRASWFACGFKKARTYKKKIPQWVFNDAFIQNLLLRSFPKLKTCNRQRDAAARWATVINLYYRNGYTYSQIADEVPAYLTGCKVRGVIRSIQRAAAGLRADSNKPRTNNRGVNLRRTKTQKNQTVTEAR